MTSDSDLDLEEALRTENPKGRLWEACASRRIAPPTIRHGTTDGRHRVEMEVIVGEWEISSGLTWGWSRKVAEQLAARALLEELDALERDDPAVRPPPSRRERAEQALGDDDIFEVDESDAARLRGANAKGQAIEWCQRQKPPVRRPRFEARKARGAILVRARLDTIGLETPWFRSSRRKDAEHAAAEALLHLLPALEDDDELAEVTTTANARTVLNELVQNGPLAACQVEVIDTSGESPEVRFTAAGFARWSDGREVRVEPHRGSSKRAARDAAARALLALVRGS